jgi:hypothetical protein
MMLITKEVEVDVSNGKNQKYYCDLGYIIPTKQDKWKKDIINVAKGTKIFVKIEDLKKGSNVYIQCLCDYCLEKGIQTIIDKQYITYNRENINAIIKKDCCKNCIPLKMKESCRVIYNCDSPLQLKEIRNQIIETNQKRYGFNCASQSDEIKNKSKQTNLRNIGVEYPTQSKEVMEVQKNTNLNKYGVENVFQSPEIISKIRRSLFNNGTTPRSSHQIYLHNLLGGELNYPVSRCSLDIAFLNEMIYIEYDGGGHDLNVKMGNISQNDFNNKERKRELFLKSQGWKEIRIISPQDKLPRDGVIIDFVNKAKEYLNAGHSWIHIDINKNKLIGNQYEIYYDFGETRVFKNSNINTVVRVFNE